MTNIINSVIINVITVDSSVNKYVITNSINVIANNYKEKYDIDVASNANYSDGNTTRNKVIKEDGLKKIRDKIFKGIMLIIKIVYHLFLFYEISMQILNLIR